MKALLYTPSLPRFFAARALGKRFPVRALPLALKELPPPERPGFRRVRVLLSGVCGSDLALLYGKSPPSLSPFFSFPAVLGHEILGEVEGVRVAVNPLLACLERGLPPCPMCQQGEEGLCQNLAEGALAPGMLGYNRDLPGGWGEWTLAREERLYPIPEGVPDERAVLAEPLAVVLRGLRRFQPWPEEVLILGMGTIGLLTLRLLRALGYGGRVYAVAKHPHQAEKARAFGANRVFGSAREALEERARRYRYLLFEGHRGGYRGVVEASGSGRGFREALALAAEGGRVLLLGAPGVEWADLSPFWFKEVGLVGSYTYTREEFREAVALLPELSGLEGLVGGVFPLAAWPEALLSKGKALFRPNVA
ncbi:theronine dehydrogenase-like Zn-dependent dehydrogenase [Thermus oshimai JL-2]|uniref:Theronine dehydrogenase-like Zn-dependent dehydrogenase n=1 Tax=Thermus oshimai JL-2 TaxID=751945 RepID=K7QUS4_THEOS|nr:zinc-binding dehydrogenase [Thermus oshimai]AFV76116.1 theronine dehydrogenase-like Zn-dependent dehydrogenase [Thermus oshimai JL-2]